MLSSGTLYKSIDWICLDNIAESSLRLGNKVVAFLV